MKYTEAERKAHKQIWPMVLHMKSILMTQIFPELSMKFIQKISRNSSSLGQAPLESYNEVDLESYPSCSAFRG